MHELTTVAPVSGSHSMDRLDRPRSDRPGLTARLATVLVLLLLLAGKGLAAAQGGLILGVHPYLSHTELQLRFQPLARYLGRLLATPVSIRVGRDYQEHVDQVGRDQIDIAYIGPVSFLQLTETYGSKPLLARLQRNGRAALDGHIVVREHSDIRSLGDLAGRTLGLGDPNSTMSSVVPIAVLRDHGIDLDELAGQIRYKGHSNIAFAVLSGQVDAGAVKGEIYEHYRARGLRSLVRLPEVSEHLFITRANLEPALVETIRQILRDAHLSAEGLNALRALHPDATALVEVHEADYAPLRALLGRDESDD
jgi:phosphonate transport system substrate-binding protein